MAMIMNCYDVHAFIRPPYPDDKEDFTDFRGDWIGRAAFPLSEDIALANLRLYSGISYESGTRERETLRFRFCCRRIILRISIR